MNLLSYFKYNSLSLEEVKFIHENYQQHSEQMDILAARFVKVLKDLPKLHTLEKQKKRACSAQIILSLICNTEEDFDLLKSLISLGKYVSDSPIITKNDQVLIPKQIISKHWLYNCTIPDFLTLKLSLFEFTLSEAEGIIANELFI